MFVEHATISAGESDQEVDRVQFMQAAVSAYSSLIFDLGAKSDFQEFKTAVGVLRDALKFDNLIPQKLKATNINLVLVREVKDQHGSVETKSLQQVEAINKAGF